MKKLLILLALAGCLWACNNVQKPAEVVAQENTEEDFSYDSLFAEAVGADDYGMRQYVMAFLKAGPNRDRDSIAAAQLQRAHLDNITRLAEEGKLVLAGPFFDDWEVKGIYIFAVETMEEARELTASDPAIQAGSLVMELHPWYGSAALMKVGDMHKKAAKSPI